MNRLVLLPVFLLIGQVACDTPDELPPLSDTDSPPPPASTVIQVQLNETIGSYRSLLGTNKDPVFSRDREEGSDVFNGSSLYQFMGITDVRLHDGNLNLCSIYGGSGEDEVAVELRSNRDLSGCFVADRGEVSGYQSVWNVREADGPTNEANYDFIVADADVRAVHDMGASLYLRLGESYSGPNYTEEPQGWAAVAKHIVEHYRGNFASSELTPTISAIEIGNEPDNEEFWHATASGTAASQEYYSLYQDTFLALRSLEGSLPPIGGSGFTPSGVLQWTGDSPDPLTNGFIDGVTAQKLDFLSGHYYGQCQDETVQGTTDFLTAMRAWADTAEKDEPLPLHITEWNLGLPGTGDCDDSVFRSERFLSFVSSFLTLAQEESLNVTHAHFYAGVGVQIATLSPQIMDTTDTSIYFNPVAWAFWAHKHLDGGTKVRTEVCEEEQCQSAFESALENKALMAVSARSGTTTYTVVSNDSDEASVVDIAYLEGPEANEIAVWELPEVAEAGTAVETELVDGMYQPTAAALAALEALPTRTVLSPFEGRVQVEVAAHSVLLVERSE